MSSWRPLCFVGAVFGGIVLLSLGVVMVASRDNLPIILLRGGFIGAALATGVFFTPVSMWVRATKDLSQARAQRVRESECADIAAYLHDSAFQALTLIRTSTEDPTRVRVIILTEERELRAWFYTGHVQAADPLDAAATEAVVGVESRRGVPISVVVIGDIRPGPGELALVTAFVEACRNTVCHGAPSVSVHVEVYPQVVEAFIKDSSEGFGPASIVTDRHGVYDSIVGRMRRIEGNATIRRLACGTEAALSALRSDILEEAAPNGKTQ